MACLMGIDLGTSSLKVMVIDVEGNIKSISSKNYQFNSPYIGYAQQDTNDWWEACCQCISEVLSKLNIDVSEIKALSFSGQMHGVVMLDKNLDLIRPAILHCDTRTDLQVQNMKKLLGPEVIQNKVLNPIYTGFLLPSLIWVKENEQENYKKIKYVCLPKDYLKLKFTGELCSDFSDASATLAYDMEKLTWSEEILNKVEVPIDIFPKCYASDYVVGKITEVASKETGLSKDTVVVNGGGDQIMQLIGNGAIYQGDTTVNIGSSGQVCYQSDILIKNFQLNTNTFCSYRKNKWICMGATMTAGLSLKWFNSLFPKTDYNVLNDEVSLVEPGCNGLVFLPYLNGERTPHINSKLSGMFLGININTNKAQMTRAVMEGVAFSLMQCLEVCSELGLKSSRMIASGGGARSSPWLQIQADIYNRPLTVSTTEEQSCLGAAIAAGTGIGIYESIEEGCKKVVKYQNLIYPNSDHHKIYLEYYQLFKNTYKDCKYVLQDIRKLGERYNNIIQGE